MTEQEKKAELARLMAESEELDRLGRQDLARLDKFLKPIDDWLDAWFEQWERDGRR